jgi:hypothetical protein
MRLMGSPFWISIVMAIAIVYWQRQKASPPYWRVGSEENYADFLFLLNVFSGLDDVWFYWPVAPLLLIVVLWAVIRREPS